MTTRLAFCVLVILCSGCGPATPPPPSQFEVQAFVREYFAAGNAGDASKVMSMILRDATVSSIAIGKITRGWEAMRTETDEYLGRANRVGMTVGTIDVFSMGPDTALAVGSIAVSPLQAGRTFGTEVPGAVTLVIRRTADGLRLIHEHYSMRFKPLP